MAQVKIKGVNTEVVESGSGHAVILLHGWGQNIEMMEPIQSALEKNFHVINLDFPCFGKSEEPKEVWGVEDYKDFLRELVLAFKLEEPILIGHSFGCRVAIRYAAQYPTRKMVLTGAAGIKPKQSLEVKTKIAAYKAAKQLLKLPGMDRYSEQIRAHFGSEDYKNAGGITRQIFVKCVNDDVTDILEKVTAPTLLIFGENDDATPVWMGKIMEEKMKDAALIIFENDDHYAYYHQINRFNRIVDVFLEKDKENNL